MGPSENDLKDLFQTLCLVVGFLMIASMGFGAFIFWLILA